MEDKYLEMMRGRYHSRILRALKPRNLVLVAFLLLAPLVNSAPPNSAGVRIATEETMALGKDAFQRGDFEAAVDYWTDAADEYSTHSQHSRLSDALKYRAQALQALGLYRAALKDLQNALTFGREAADPKRVASVMGILGNTYLLAGSPSEARHYLEESIALAKDLGEPGVAAVGLNNLGNLYSGEQHFDEALSKYTEAIELAETANSQILLLKGLINAARTVAEMDQTDQSEALLERAAAISRPLPTSHDKAFGLIAMGRLYQQASGRSPQSKAHLSLSAYQLFEEAERMALDMGDLRAASYASGYLGQLYESEQRYDEALQLSSRAAFRAQQINASELLYRWHWQTGRILGFQGNAEGAVSAYRLAVDNVQSIRQDLTAAERGDHSSFKDTIGRLFYELVALLLQQEKAALKPQDKVPYLKEARDTIEALKAAELQDYFLDDCVVAHKSKIEALETVAPRTAIIYPILFKDRIELLLSISDRIDRYTVPVSMDALTEQIRLFRRRLQGERSERYLRQAYKLYRWLVLPMEGMLETHEIDTLVIVPDGPLRTIPMAALHDGEQLLIDRYAVVTTPGLTLTDPRPLRPEAVQALGAGLSASVQGYPSLPGVALELDVIEKTYGGTRLQDETFIVKNLRRELSNTAYSVVHVATHARFESDVRKSFLLTYDSKLSMDQLEELIGLSQYRDQPVELLTLSACQTGLGDDRAALGLAGVAVKSGARSALATLWNISDEATSSLISEFYRQLANRSVSKAEALRQAQLKMINDPRFQHPAFWSPFLLIGNWL